MIAVFSTRRLDETTFQVTDWIEKLGGNFIRFNAEDFPNQPFAASPEGPGGTILVKTGCDPVSSDRVSAVWYRRTAKTKLPDCSAIEDSFIRSGIKRHMEQEMSGAVTVVTDALAHAHWLSHPDTVCPNKFAALKKARGLGLTIPETLVTNSRAALRKFLDQHGSLIIKCVTDSGTFEKGEQAYAMLTSELSAQHIDQLPRRCFPVLVQKKVPKAWEIRTFYLNGACHSMAIFSQANPQTQLDFRRYDFEKPNRTVPYELNPELETKVAQLMAQLGLNTGSLDFIRTPGGDTVFLEVNPVGQFGMVSIPCNQGLEKKVAQHLIAKDQT